MFWYFELPEDKKVFTEMIEKARNGFIEDIKYKSDVSVVVQQILSLTMEKYNEDNGKLTYKKIHEFLDILVSKPEHVDLIIEKMISDDYIQESRGKIIPTTKLLDFQSKFRMGKSINANISGSNVMQVVDQSGKVLGEMEKPTEKINKIQFASRKWDVSEIQKNKVIVKRTMTGETSTPNFTPNSNYGSWYSSLPDKLKGFE